MNMHIKSSMPQSYPAFGSFASAKAASAAQKPTKDVAKTAMMAVPPEMMAFATEMTAVPFEKQAVTAELVSMPPEMQSFPGQVLVGRFGLEGQLAKGQRFALYKAWDMTLQQTVVAKVLRREVGESDDSWNDIKHRFAMEAHWTQMMEHRNVIQALDWVEEPDLCILVLEHLEGMTLRQWLRGHRPSPKQALSICLQLCRALQHVHDMGVVHRDLKPTNVMLTSCNRVVLIDFGIALDLLGSVDPTEGKLIRGTPGYLAPEQLHGWACSFQTDIYALGLIMFELLTGAVLFRGASVERVLSQHLAHRIPLMSDFLSCKSDPIWVRMAGVIQQCLRRKSTERFSSVVLLWQILSTPISKTNRGI